MCVYFDLNSFFGVLFLMYFTHCNGCYKAHYLLSFKRRQVFSIHPKPRILSNELCFTFSISTTETVCSYELKLLTLFFKSRCCCFLLFFQSAMDKEVAIFNFQSDPKLHLNYYFCVDFFLFVRDCVDCGYLFYDVDSHFYDEGEKEPSSYYYYMYL